MHRRHLLQPISPSSGIPGCLQTHYVPEINLKFMILLPLFPKSRGYKSRPQDPIYVVLKSKPKAHVNQVLYLLRYNLNSEVLSHGLFSIAIRVSSTPCVYIYMFGIKSLLEELQIKIVYSTPTTLRWQKMVFSEFGYASKLPKVLVEA